MLRRLAKSEGGFGLVELLIAIAVLAIGITAVAAGYSSGILAVDRAGLTSTAGALADRQMELYRQAGYASLTPAALSGASQTGTDGRTYWVGTTISWTCVVGPPNTTTVPSPPPTCSGTPASRPVKLVAIEVHKGATSSGDLAFGESATFDSSTG